MLFIYGFYVVFYVVFICGVLLVVWYFLITRACVAQTTTEEPVPFGLVMVLCFGRDCAFMQQPR